MGGGHVDCDGGRFFGSRSFLVVRNEHLEPNVSAMVRIVLSFAIAVLGGTIPGFLKVDWSARGLLIRAGGALALFVLTFLVLRW
jgi:hypothetical protein